MTPLWWHWLAVGLILGGLELAGLGGFYLVFFGIAASLMALLLLVGIGGPIWLQLLLFAALALGSLVLRNPLVRWLKLEPHGAPVDSMVGDVAVPLEEIAPGAVGRAELRGTVWSARNRAARALVRGERCRVITVEQLMIFIEPEGAR